MSNADRIARARAEAAATEREKEEKRKAKAAKPAATKRTRKKATPSAPQRMKLVWAVGKYGQEPAKTFPYAQKAEAQAEAERIGNSHIVTPLKLPMEE